MAEKLLNKRMRQLDTTTQQQQQTVTNNVPSQQPAPDLLLPTPSPTTPLNNNNNKIMSVLNKIQDYQVPVRATLTCPRELKICQVTADSSSSSASSSHFDSTTASNENIENHHHLTAWRSTGQNQQPQLGVFADTFILENTQFGPLQSTMVGYLRDTYDRFVLRLVLPDGTAMCYFDLEDLEASNWMACVRRARWREEQNVEAFQHPSDYQIFYRATCNIAPGTELRVWYTQQYAEQVHCTQPLKTFSAIFGLAPLVPATPTTKDELTSGQAAAPAKRVASRRNNNSKQAAATAARNAAGLVSPAANDLVNDWLTVASSSNTKKSPSRSKRSISLIRRELLNNNNNNNNVVVDETEGATMSATSTSHTPQLDAGSVVAVANSNNVNTANEDDDDVEMIESYTSTRFLPPNNYNTSRFASMFTSSSPQPPPLANTNALLDALEKSPLNNNNNNNNFCAVKTAQSDSFASAAAAANSQLTAMMMMLTKDNAKNTSTNSNSNNNNNPSLQDNPDNNNSTSSTAPSTPTSFSRKKNILMSFTNASKQQAAPSCSSNDSAATHQSLLSLPHATPASVVQQQQIIPSPSINQYDSNPSSSVLLTNCQQQNHHHLMSMMLAAAAAGGAQNNNNNNTEPPVVSCSTTPSSTILLPFSFSAQPKSTTSTQHHQFGMDNNGIVFRPNNNNIPSHNQRHIMSQQLPASIFPSMTAGQQNSNNLTATLLAMQHFDPSMQNVGDNSAAASAPSSFFFGPVGQQPRTVDQQQQSQHPQSSSMMLNTPLLLLSSSSDSSTRSTGSSSGAQPPQPSSTAGDGGSSAQFQPNNPTRSNPISNSSNSDSPIVVDLESEEDDEVAAIDLRVQQRLAAEQQQNMLNAFQFNAPPQATHFQPAVSNSLMLPSAELAAVAAAAAAVVQQQQQGAGSQSNNNMALSTFNTYRQLLANAVAVAAASSNNNNNNSNNNGTGNAMGAPTLSAKTILSCKLAAKQFQESSAAALRAAPNMHATAPLTATSTAAMNMSQLLGLPPLSATTSSTLSSMLSPGSSGNAAASNWMAAHKQPDAGAVWLMQQQQQNMHLLNAATQQQRGVNPLNCLDAWRSCLSTSQTSHGATVNPTMSSSTAFDPIASPAAHIQAQALARHQHLQNLVELTKRSNKSIRDNTQHPVLLHNVTDNKPSLLNGHHQTAGSLGSMASSSGYTSEPAVIMQKHQSPTSAGLPATSSGNASPKTETLGDPQSFSADKLTPTATQFVTITGTLNGATTPVADAAAQTLKNGKSATSSSTQPAKKREKTKKPSVPCATCGKSFSAAKDLKRHLATHTGIKPHACQHCGKKFSRKDHVRRHVMTVHDKTYKPKKKAPKKQPITPDEAATAGLIANNNSNSNSQANIASADIDLLLDEEKNKMLEMQALVDIVRPDADEVAALAGNADATLNSAETAASMNFPSPTGNPNDLTASSVQLNGAVRAPQDFALIWHNYSNPTV